MSKKFNEGVGGGPKTGVAALLSQTAAVVEPPKQQESQELEDPEAWVLKTYHMKNKRINEINNLVHHLKTQGNSLIGQKEVVEIILEAGLRAQGYIPERPDEIKAQEKLRQRRK